MLRVPLDHARPGMVLAMPVEHPLCPSTVLLRANVPLDTHSISRLRELGAGHVWIRHPSLEFVVAHINPWVTRACGDLATVVGQAWDAVRDRAESRLDYDTYRDTVAALLERLTETPRAAVFVDEVAAPGSEAMRHAANVCFLSLVMGLKLEFYLLRERNRLNAAAARDVTNLGVGALLHDIGLARLDPAELTPWRKTQDDATGPWRRHVEIGHAIVKDSVDPSAAAIVLHHHQHCDGSGFPAFEVRPAGKPPGPCGSDIHVFARIVAAADLFDRLRYPPGVADSACPTTVEVLNQMHGPPFNNWLDPLVFKSLVSVAPAYPPGTWVTLNDGRSAVVENWSAKDPCRPIVRIIDPLAEEGLRRQVKTERIDLRRIPEAEIVEMEGRDVHGKNFYPTKDRDYDLTRTAKSMINAAA